MVDDAGRVLLARRAHDPDAGLWDTLGGFLDEDEHPLDGLRREIREEAGAAIEVLDFVGAYPDRYGDGEDAPVALNLVWEVTLLSDETSSCRPTTSRSCAGSLAASCLTKTSSRSAGSPAVSRITCVVPRRTEGPASRPFS